MYNLYLTRQTMYALPLIADHLDTRRYTISEKNGRRRNSNLNLDKDTTQFLKRRSISKGAGEKSTGDDPLDDTDLTITV